MFSLSDLLVQVGRRQRRQRGLYGATWVLLSLTIVMWLLFVVDPNAVVSTSGRLLIGLWLAPVAAALLASVIAARHRTNIVDLLLCIDQKLGTGERLSSLYEANLRAGPDVFRYRIEKALRSKPLPWRRAIPFHRPTLAVLCAAILLWGGLGGMVASTLESGLGSDDEVRGVVAGGGVYLDPEGLPAAEEARDGEDEQTAHRAGGVSETGVDDDALVRGSAVGSSPQVGVGDDLLAALAALEAFVTSEASVLNADADSPWEDAERREEALARARALLESAQSRTAEGRAAISQADLDEIDAIAAELMESIDESTLAALSEFSVPDGEVRSERAVNWESFEDNRGDVIGDEQQDASAEEEQQRLDDPDQQGQTSGDSTTEDEDTLGESGGLNEADAGATQRPLVSALGSPGFVTERLGGALTSATSFRELLTQGIPVEPIYEPDGEAINALQVDPLRLQAIVEQRSLSMRERDLIEAYFRAVTQGGT